MVIAGLANKIWKKLVAVGTYVTHPYAKGKANKKPKYVQVESIEYQAPDRAHEGMVAVTIQVEEEHSYQTAKHLGSIILIDVDKTEVISLDYHNNLRQLSDTYGNLSKIELSIPKGTFIPTGTTAYVILDVYPIFKAKLAS